jgi:signal transduction histidine kinase
MHGVDIIDSCSLGQLVGWQRRLAEQDVDFRLLNITPQVRQILQLSQLLTILNVGPREGAAIDQESWRKNKLLETLEYAEQIMAALGDGIIGLSEGGEVLFIDSGAQILLNCAEADLLGCQLDECLKLFDEAGDPVPSHNKPICASIQRGGEPFKGECRVSVGAGREERALSLAVTPLHSSGQITGGIASLRDISELKRAESERRQRERLEGVLELAGAACHELSQPLHAISSYIDLMLRKMAIDDADEEWTLEKLYVVQEQVDKMIQLTKKLSGITIYQTCDYLKGVKIIDLDRSANRKKMEAQLD